MLLLRDLLHNPLCTRLERIAVNLTAPEILPHRSRALLMRVTRQREPLEGNLLWLRTGEIRNEFLGLLFRYFQRLLSGFPWPLCGWWLSCSSRGGSSGRGTGNCCRADHRLINVDQTGQRWESQNFIGNRILLLWWNWWRFYHWLSGGCLWWCSSPAGTTTFCFSCA